MTKEQRDELTISIYDNAVRRGLYSPKMKCNGWCRTGETWNDGVECGEVNSDFWHVKIFDDGTFQIGWLELGNYGTCLVTRTVNHIEDVYSFLTKQREYA